MKRLRFPGVTPFAGDALSRKLFFGREHEAAELLDLVLAEPLVILYAPSGMGKSSLLNAALKEDLWKRGFLPLLANVTGSQGPLAPVRKGIREAIAARRSEAGEEFEHDEVATEVLMLWEYFRTAQFWRGDLLLTSVLILDQFEDLFMHPPEDRAAFARELAALVRGVGSVPSPAKVVLSLREDYLAHLEELADDLPQILQHRFRLEPLNRAGVVDAVRLPAAFNEQPLAQLLATAPFEVTDDAISGTWTFLSKSVLGRAAKSHPVEPFQLQLVCDRIEAIAQGKEAESRARGEKKRMRVSWLDLGGEGGLARTIASFYERTLAKLPSEARSRVQQLCEYGLVTRHARRTSLDEDAILERFKIDRVTLHTLVDQLLLRADWRLGVSFYELSHDTLIAPVVAAREARERQAQYLKRALGAVVLAVAVVVVVPSYVSSWFGRRNLAAAFAWVAIPAGKDVSLGCTGVAPSDCAADKAPYQKALIPSFEIMKAEVTNQRFDEFIKIMGNNWIARLQHPLNLRSTVSRRGLEPAQWKADGLEGRFEEHPAVRVTWYEAETFCAFVGGRLPSEEEWEYAARRRPGLVYPWGESPRAGAANLGREDSDRFVGTAPVGSFQEWEGLFDMSGNVAEWTSSYWNAVEPEDAERAVRGGSWGSSFESARLFSRASLAPYSPDRFVGFRCIR